MTRQKPPDPPKPPDKPSQVSSPFILTPFFSEHPATPYNNKQRNQIRTSHMLQPHGNALSKMRLVQSSLEADEKPNRA